MATIPGLAITNPLVLYRSLLATKQILPDAGQHRLAIRLQGLYDTIKDYEPEKEYGQRLSGFPSDRLAGNFEDLTHISKRGSWRSLLSQRERADSLSLTRTVPRAEAIRNVNSPRGLMLHGEVGTGKSMLVDMFADCLPSRKKARWHFNTFLLDVFSKLETHRRMEREAASRLVDNEYSISSLAQNMVQSSPILFLDEFQLPDRASSKIMTNLMISFFQHGGVLIATSNRMPEELDKAAGVTFTQPPSRFDSIRWRLGLTSGKTGRSENLFAGNTEFAEFLDILKSRCDVWEMPGKNDYRRRESMTLAPERHAPEFDFGSSGELEAAADSDRDLPSAPSDVHASTSMPINYLIQQPLEQVQAATARIIGTPQPDWQPHNLRVYGRTLTMPQTCRNTICASFAELCESFHGPADYITISSAFDTIILLDVPVLTLARKNEARRFITLLDALYEARCKLLVSAAAGPDELFFPDSTEESGIDAVHPETFAEAYQDMVAPFRPNISTHNAEFSEDIQQPDYTHARMQGVLAADSLEDDPPNRIYRHNDNETVSASQTLRQTHSSLNFAGTGAFTGEDERFAYKRARSRLWEMTGERWWARTEPGWHRPAPASVRRWEQDVSDSVSRRHSGVAKESDVQRGMDKDIDPAVDEVMFRHGASPFRRSSEPPPKFSWTHIWGTMKWAKKAGVWGQGVDGLKDRKREP